MSRYPLLWFLTGLVAGIGAEANAAAPTATAVVVAALVLGAGWLATGRTATVLPSLPGVMAGWLVVTAAPLPTLPVELALRRQFDGLVRVTADAGGGRYGAALSRDGEWVPLLVTMPDTATSAPGAVWQAAGAVREALGARWPGGFDYHAHLGRNGYAGLATLRTVRLVQAGEPGWRARLWSWRRMAREHTRTALGARGDWAVAFFFGEQAGLDPEEQQRLQVAGLGHILAVSGLNVGLVAWLAAGLGFFLPRWPRLVWTGAAVAAYALLVGFQPSVARAALMLLAALLPPLLSRPVIGVHTVSLAAVLILLADPWSLFAPGFQLSFVVAFFLVWAAANWPRLTVAWWGAPALAAVAQLAATPLMLHYFNFCAPAALAVNIILLPTFAWLLVWALIAVVPWPLLASPAAALFAAQVDGLQAVAELGERCWRHVNLPPPPVWWQGAVYALLLLVLWPPLRRRAVWLLALAALLALPLVQTVPPRVDICEVGLGDAVLLHGSDEDMLIDAGPATGARLLLQQLRVRGVNRLARVIITHPDEDHCGGLPLLLREVPVGVVLHRDWTGADTASQLAVAALAAAGVRQQPVDRVMTLAWREGTLTIFPPGGASTNDRSLVVRLVTRRQAFLFAADIEEAGVDSLLALGLPLTATALKLPHHGAHNDRLPALLAAVRPQVAVVTAPLRNRFSFPHPATLTALQAAGVTVRQTGREGRISFPLDDDLKGIP